jgi:hypothetical protein
MMGNQTLPGPKFPYRDESMAVVYAPMDRIFAYLDEHTQLSAHMSESSWKLGWGRMVVQLDEARGQALGSRIRLSGRVFGLQLSVEEVVSERDPPHRKFWETIGTPRLLVIGQYRMGFELSRLAQGSLLRVSIDYALPANAPARWLGRALGPYYARWCTQKMVDDAVGHFATLDASAASPP